MPGSPALGQRLNLPSRATQGPNKCGRQALGLCCHDPVPAGAPSCPGDQQPVAKAEGILGELSRFQGSGHGWKELCDTPLSLRSSSSWLLRCLPSDKLWDWDLDTQGQAGFPWAGLYREPGLSRPCLITRGQREKVEYEDWSHQKCSLHSQNHLGISKACGEAGRWRRLPTTSAPHALPAPDFPRAWLRSWPSLSSLLLLN